MLSCVEHEKKCITSGPGFLASNAIKENDKGYTFSDLLKFLQSYIQQ